MRILCSATARLRAYLLACAIAMPYAVSAQSTTYEVPPPAPTELENLTARAMRLFHAGETDASVRAFEAASAFAEQRFGVDDPKFVKALNNLALIYDVGGRLDRAERLYRQAIAIVANKAAPPPAQLANLRNNLAAVVLQQCRIEEAQNLYKQALALSEQSLGAHHGDTRMMRANVARLDRYLGAPATTRAAPDDVTSVGQMLQRCIS